MVSDEIAEMFTHALGLDTTTIGSLAIERVIRDRLSACVLRDPHEYCEHVRTSASELQELIEAVVVPETWFFRDREAFVEFARIVVTQCRAHSDRMLRLLSLPCSTGEEPYSMAMALFDAGVEPNRFHIDAVDISSRALERGRRAMYGKNSFRGSDLDFRERHFEATPGGYRLHDAVRRPVHFTRGNLLAAEFVPPAAQYDVIFCRNLLIYFARAAQERAIAIVQRLLKPGGVVFVGPAEAGLLFAHEFIWSKVPLAFAFVKDATVARVARIAPSASALEPPRSYALKLAPASRTRTFSKGTQKAATELLGIDEATRLADLGRFVEAAQLCEAHIRSRGPSPQALHLMGLICSADGALSKAAKYFRQALYLDPTYGASASHLALLLEKRGDVLGAQLLRGRARRVKRQDAS
jgi:chemotaxis protein methyltransferase WspC